MARLRISLLLGAAASLLAVSLTHAGGRGTQYAFLVGCGNYRKSEFRALPFTGNDVLRFRDALLQTGFEPGGVVVLHDRAGVPRYAPERAKILEALELLLDGLRPEDTIVVALSGHGVQYKGDPVSYFVPTDGKVADKRTLIALDGPGGLYEKLRACKAKKKLLVVNACRNDPTVSIDFASSKVELTDEDRDEVPEGIAAIYSCSAGQKSYYDPDRKIALFYEHLAKAWLGGYTPGGTAVTLEDVLRQTTVQTRLDAMNNLGVKQTPWVRREYKGEWTIAAARVKHPPAKTTTVPDAGPVAAMRFIRIPKGTCWVGGGSYLDPVDKQWKRRPPQKQVMIGQDFEMAAYCITQGQWRAVMNDNPSYFSREGNGKKAVATFTDADLASLPVENISWNRAQEFVRRLNEREQGKGWLYRLPTEAEWEYACRNAAPSKEECSFDFYFARGSNDLGSTQANFDGDTPAGNGARGPALRRTAPVGSYAPNRLGLFDMHGNVWQWCSDAFDDKATHRAKRGGSYFMAGRACAAGNREGTEATRRWTDTGLRLVRVPAPVVTDPLVAEMRFVHLAPATFWMGGGTSFDLADKQWKTRPPQRQVMIDHDFEIAAYLVTQGQWQAVMGTNPSGFSRQGVMKDRVKGVSDADLARFPVENVSWNDVQGFLRKLNEREAGKGWSYRLPTEAEREYACRNAGQTRAECAYDFYFEGGTFDLSSTQANFNGNFPAGKGARGPFLNRPTKVGSYPPNRLGLYDMHGNVHQMLADAPEGEPSLRLFTAGGWHNPGPHLVALGRDRVPASQPRVALGFRLVRVAAGTP